MLRGVVQLGSLTLLGLAVIACSPQAASPAQVPPATGLCDAVTFPPVQGGTHLIGGEPPPTPYNSIPPTSGWHTSGAFEIAVQPPDEPLTEPEQVSVLEAGAVVVAYHDLGPDDRARLVALIDSEFDGRVAVTVYDRLEPGEVAVTTWGALQRCERLDVDAVRRFAEVYAAADPAVPGVH